MADAEEDPGGGPRPKVGAGPAPPPPGWILREGRIEPELTAAGARVRGAVLKGRCQTAECRRSVTVDLETWTQHGFGGASLAALQRLYLCSRLGCGLSFQPEVYPAGAPLQFFAADSRASVTLRCKRCRRRRVVPAGAFLETLRRTGAGDGNSGVLDLDHRFRNPCAGCGRRDWSVRFSPDGQDPGED